MAIKTYKPCTPSRRYITGLGSEDVTAKPGARSLLVKLPAHAGRSSYGRITSRHKEAGAKKLYRIIDFRRRRFGVEEKAEAIKYDLYKSCRVALISYKDNEKRYILRLHGLSVGDIIAAAGGRLDTKPSDAVRPKNTPVGTIIYNVELKPGKDGQMIHSVGAYAQLMGKGEKYVILGLTGGEMRQVLAEYMASIGEVGNEEWASVTIGKTGRNCHRGIRPQTRGSAMDPVDHPHGGGEGKKNSDRHPVTPQGKPTKGAKTRRKKASDKLTISGRKGK